MVSKVGSDLRHFQIRSSQQIVIAFMDPVQECEAVQLVRLRFRQLRSPCRRRLPELRQSTVLVQRQSTLEQGRVGREKEGERRENADVGVGRCVQSSSTLK